MPPEKHESQCLQATVTLGEAWLDTNIQDTRAGEGGAAGQEEQEDGAPACHCAQAPVGDLTQHSGTCVGLMLGPGSSGPGTHLGILALDSRAIPYLTSRLIPLEVEGLALGARRS